MSLDSDGLRVLVRQTDGPLAAACVFVGSGSAYETPDTYGITSLVNSVALSTVPVIEIEQLGGRVEAYTGSEFSCFKLNVPVKNLGPALRTLGGAIAAPVFDEQTIIEEKRELACRTGVTEDMPVELGYRRLVTDEGRGERPGLCVGGDAGPAGRLSAKDLSAWHAARYVRGNIVVSVCADMPAEEAGRLAAAAFKGLKPGRRTPPARSNAAAVAKDSASEAPSGRTVALVSFPAPAAGTADYAAIRVAEAAVADGMGSMLFRAYRLDGKLAYSFGCILPETGTYTRLTFYVEADSGSVDAAVGRLMESVARLKRGDIGPTALERARARAAGALKMEAEGAAGLAWMDGLAEMLGEDRGYWETLAGDIAKVGADDISRVARKYLDGQAVLLVPSGTAGG